MDSTAGITSSGGGDMGSGGSVTEIKRPAAAVAMPVAAGGMKKARVCTAKERISRMAPCTAGKRSSIYRGVTRHRWTGRYEAHLWDKSTWNQNQNKKGKQVYLGAYDDEEAAARAYDLAALKYWGAGTLINFPVSDYSRDLEEMQMFSKEDYLVSLRRKSSAFSRGFPKYRGIARQLQGNRWDGSVGQMLGNSYLNNVACRGDAVLEEKYASGFGMERKIDLTNYIRWWMPKKPLVPNSEDIDRELQSLQTCRGTTEPYRLPSLGINHKEKSEAHGLSACDILSRSSAFKNFEESLSENKNVASSKDAEHSKVQTLFAGVVESTGVTSGSDALAVQRAPPYTFTPFLPVPSRANWNPIDPQDPGFWTNFFPPT